MRSPRPRKTAELSKSLHRQLNSYALAASAAGVSALAMAQPAEARIVYTPAHTQLHSDKPFYLDLNHDGINDFGFFLHANSRVSSLYVEGAQKGNETWYSIWSIGNVKCAYPAQRGALIGPNVFGTGKHFMFQLTTGADYCDWDQSPTRAYVGLKFLIKGRVHYAWARFVTYRGLSSKLTGYAYETIPNKPIVAGKTHGPDVIVEPATLGNLAAGRR